MRNPWLEIPLADYEAHMALPQVAQAQLLANIFGRILTEHGPRSPFMRLVPPEQLKDFAERNAYHEISRWPEESLGAERFQVQAFRFLTPWPWPVACAR